MSTFPSSSEAILHSVIEYRPIRQLHDLRVHAILRRQFVPVNKRLFRPFFLDLKSKTKLTSTEPRELVLSYKL